MSTAAARPAWTSSSWKHACSEAIDAAHLAARLDDDRRAACRAAHPLPLGRAGDAGAGSAGSIATPFEAADLTRAACGRTAGRHLRLSSPTDRRRGFDLAAAPLWRVTLFRLRRRGIPHGVDLLARHPRQFVCGSAARSVRRLRRPAWRRAADADRAPRVPRPHPVAEGGPARAREAITAFWRERLAGFSTLDQPGCPAAAGAAGNAHAGHDTVRFRACRAPPPIASTSWPTSAWRAPVHLRRCGLGAGAQRLLRRAGCGLRRDPGLPAFVDRRTPRTSSACSSTPCPCARSSPAEKTAAGAAG